MKIKSLGDLTAAVEQELEQTEETGDIFVKVISVENCTYIRRKLTEAIGKETDPAEIEKMRHLVALFK